MRYNLCDDYMQVLRDGGALYCWCSGTDKVWEYNAGRRASNGDSSVRAIHIDDNDVGNIIRGNRFYAEGATDFSHYPEQNLWEDNIVTEDEVPDGYEALRAKIIKEAGRLGVWLDLADDFFGKSAGEKEKSF